MKKIFVRKIFAYDPTLNGKYSKFDGYKKIMLGEVKPEVDTDSKVNVREIDSPIYSSDIDRGVKTALTVAKQLKINDVKKIKELDEVIFDLGKLVNKSEFEKGGSNLVRSRFVEAFIDNKLNESRKSLKTRIKSFITIIEKLPDGKYLFISHSFFMKLLQIYLKYPNLFEKPQILKKHFVTTKRTFEFGKGFDFNVK